jgi:hypothetical protein
VKAHTRRKIIMLRQSRHVPQHQVAGLVVKRRAKATDSQQVI